jgi:hypothetical protein
MVTYIKYIVTIKQWNGFIYTDKVISMKILIIKSLLTSLYQREGNYPSLAKSVRLATERGEGRFFNNVVLLITALVKAGHFYFGLTSCKSHLKTLPKSCIFQPVI